MEWIECGLPYDKYGDVNSFTYIIGRKNLPGMLIETKHGKLLIGHINSIRGICDDCVEFHESTIVIRYRRVYDPGTSVDQGKELPG